VLLAASACGAPAAPPDYSLYGGVLMGFVDDNGLVDYASLKEQRGDLDDFALYLEHVKPEAYASWAEADQIAFWVNAYNALTLRAIIDNYPIEPEKQNLSFPKNSIRQIHGVWDFNRVNVMGQSITLQFIETKYLRRDFSEPRIHMALVCAAVSCPKLRQEPYQGDRLEAQLADQTRTFLSNPRNFRIDRAGNKVYLSEIFRWYQDDFAPKDAAKKTGGLQDGVIAFVMRYVGETERAFLMSGKYRIDYIPYDWSLNEQPH